jgi:predicted permease
MEIIMRAALTAEFGYALRILRKRRGFTAVAILTLAIGIGSATAAFSILDPWLLRPLPLKDARQLYALWRTAAANPAQPAFFFGYRDYLGFSANAQSFTGMGASFHRSFTMIGAGKPEEVSGEIASQSLFPTLDANAFIGRTFLPEDLTGEKTAVVSFAFWEKKLGGSRSAIGQTLNLNDEPYRIIGVLPKEFSYRVLDVPFDAEVWTLIRPDDPLYTADSYAGVGVVARLKQGVSPGQAQAELSLLQQRMDSQSSRRYEVFEGTGTLMAGLQEDNARPIRSSLLVLAAAVGCVLLIACANTTALILGRNATRDGEFAIRAALGAGLRRLMQQLFAESLALYVCGALGGLLLAWAAVSGFAAWNPFGVIPARGVALSLRALGVAVAITLVASLFFGALPAFYGSRLNLSDALRGGAHNATLRRGRIRAQAWIVAAQIAVSLALVSGTGVLVSTLLRLERQDFGFNPSAAETFQLFLPNSRYAKQGEFVRFQGQFLDRLRELPGVTAAASGPQVAYGDATEDPFAISGQPSKQAGDMPHAVITPISSQFFRALKIPLVQGEDFPDSAGPSEEPLAVINEMAARLCFPDSNPIGQHIRIGDPADPASAQAPPTQSWCRITGIVGDTLSLPYNRLVWQTRAKVYVDYRGQKEPATGSKPWGSRFVNYIVASAPGRRLGLDELQSAVWSLDPELPVKSPETIRSVLMSRLAPPRTLAQALSAFAVISLFLAAIGVYGVLAQSVASRRPEIAVRFALGAQPGDILRLVLRRAMFLALAGVVAGTVLVLSVSRVLQSVVYGTSVVNPLLYGGAAGLLLAVALLAAYLPARRAASVDPVSTLRAE